MLDGVLADENKCSVTGWGLPCPCSGMSVNRGYNQWYAAMVYNHGIQEVNYDAFSVLEKEIEQVGAGVDSPTTYTEVTVDQAEIQKVIVNLLNNSLYWLKQVPKDSRFITVKVDKKEEYELEIIFSDSVPGIEEEYEGMIFDPYFSTKPNGVGLGLTIAGEIVSDYYDGRIALI